MADSADEKLTPKEESFAIAVGAGVCKTLTDAYSRIYETGGMKPETVGRRASELAAKPRVAARIQLVRERAANAAVKKAAYTLEAALDEADELIEAAKAHKQTSAGVAALKLKAQLAGHLVEKKEVSTTSQLSDSDSKAIAEMKAQAEAALKAAQDMVDMVGIAAEAEAGAQSLRKAA
jgi:hypothetical protein